MNQNISEARQKFDAAIESFYESKNPDSCTIFSFIQGRLYQFRLSKAYEVKDILSVVYARGVKLVEAGIEIRNPQAWVKRTAFNVIREFRRGADKTCYLDPQHQSTAPAEDCFSECVMEEEWKAIQIAFNRLSPKDQNVLRLRIVNGLSWQEVSALLVTEGEEEQAEGTLRLRGYRALQKLRKIYDQVREGSEAKGSEDGENAGSAKSQNEVMIEPGSQTPPNHLDAWLAREGNSSELDN